MNLKRIKNIEQLLKVASGIPKIDQYEDLMQFMEDLHQWIEENATTSIETIGDKNSALFEREDSAIKYLLHPSTYEEDKWQITCLVEEEPSGHTTYDTKNQAIKDIADGGLGGQGYTVTKTANIKECNND